MRLLRCLPFHFLFLCLLLAACGGNAARSTDAAPEAADGKSMEQCQGIFLFGPARYVISLVAGEEITLDPARYPIPVYCTPEQAHQAAKEAYRSGWAPASMELRVYKLDGEWRAMVRRDGDKRFLNKPAALIDFIE